MTYYKHKQYGRVIVYCMTGTILLLVTSGLLLGTLNWMWPAIALLCLAAFLFGSLTTEIRDGVLHCRFGPGFFHKRFPLGEIVTVEPVRNSWIWGWGIRYTPRGWLYNVSGLDAVELGLTNGKRVRIGTDRPEELARALRESIAMGHPGT